MAALPFPTTPIIDVFPADGGPPPPSGNWGSVGGVAGLIVAGGQLQAAAAVTSFNYWSTQFQGDQECYIQIQTKAPGGAAPAMALGFGYDIALLNGYSADVRVGAGPPDAVRFFRIDAGVGTQLGVNIGQVFTDGDWFGVKREGTTLYAYHSADGVTWTPVGSRVDGTYTGAGNVAVGMTNNDEDLWRLKYFGGGDTVDIAALLQGPQVRSAPVNLPVPRSGEEV